jgi:hypothetical protein
MNRELQRAQDMLAGMQAQRDNALNAVVMLQADLAAARRALEEVGNELTEERAQLAASQAAYIAATTLPAGDEQKLTNGVDLSPSGGDLRRPADGPHDGVPAI